LASILLIDNKETRKQKLERYLSEAGYGVCGISDARSLRHMDCSGFDLAIINLYPDANRTWAFYRRFKEQYPGLPVLVYLENSFSALRSLKQAIGLILGKPQEVAPGILSRTPEDGPAVCRRH